MTTETYEFHVAEPVRRAPRKGAGRRAEPNPFIDGVRSIVGKTDESGAPLTLAAPFTLNHARNETLKQRSARIRRALTKAGKLIATENDVQPYAIEMRVEESGDSYVVKFWDRRAGK